MSTITNGDMSGDRQTAISLVIDELTSSEPLLVVSSVQPDETVVAGWRREVAAIKAELEACRDSADDTDSMALLESAYPRLERLIELHQSTKEVLLDQWNPQTLGDTPTWTGDQIPHRNLVRHMEVAVDTYLKFMKRESAFDTYIQRLLIDTAAGEETQQAHAHDEPTGPNGLQPNGHCSEDEEEED